MKRKRPTKVGDLIDLDSIPEEELQRLELRDSVRALRQHLKQSQQAFATMLGLSIRAIASYESDGRIPEAQVLSKLAKAAADAGVSDIANEFLRELGTNLRLAEIREGSMLDRNPQGSGGFMLVQLKDEQAYKYASAFISAFDAVSSNNESRNGPAKIALENLVIEATKIPRNSLFKRDFKSQNESNR